MAESPPAPAELGVVGLGTMGGQMARHLLAAGYRVTGRDVEPDRAAALTALGGTAAASPAEVAARAGAVVLSLPSVAAFEQVIEGADGLVSGAGPGLAVIEASTLPLPVKERGRQLLADRGAVMLDCPISGTGAQIRGKDVVIYASGDPATLARMRPVLAAFSRAQVDLGAFGNGTKLKLVANLLVASHNVAAAEALLLAGRAGLDPQQALAALTAGAGTSRMLEVRGPLMVAGEYGEASMRVATFQKDLDIIAAFAAGLGCPVPVFEAAAQVHGAALAGGHANEDTASVFAVLQQLAGRPGPSPAAPPSVSSGSQATYDD
jgi:3-hydroxyisobutyrate dehydrogenase-like beta-hydroxyacid dehydrogenase